MDALASAALLVAAYLAGALPWGVVLGRFFSGLDLRRFGSGSTGTTNAYRVLGWRISLAVLALDFLKGLIPVVAARWLGGGEWVVAAAAVLAVVGHCWSPLIGFDGGKGMATGAGASAGMVPWVLVVIPVMVAIVSRTRYVSLASLAGSLLGAGGVVVAALAGLVDAPYAIAVAAIAAIIVVQHRGNIERLRSGTERQLGRAATESRAEESRLATGV